VVLLVFLQAHLCLRLTPHSPAPCPCRRMHTLGTAAWPEPNLSCSRESWGTHLDPHHMTWWCWPVLPQCPRHPGAGFVTQRQGDTARTELIFFVGAGRVLCSGFVLWREGGFPEQRRELAGHRQSACERWWVTAFASLGCGLVFPTPSL